MHTWKEKQHYLGKNANLRCWMTPYLLIKKESNQEKWLLESLTANKIGEELLSLIWWKTQTHLNIATHTAYTCNWGYLQNCQFKLKNGVRLVGMWQPLSIQILGTWGDVEYSFATRGRCQGKGNTCCVRPLLENLKIYLKDAC